MKCSTNRAVFLDRDGVINRASIRGGKSYAPLTVDQFELLPGVIDALISLKKAGYLLVVVTNQPDVAKGTLAREMLDAMHEKLRAWVPIDDIRVCDHVDDDKCSCRKPKPGMLQAAADDLSINLKASFMVGDRWRDVCAGNAAGCRVFFVESEIDEPMQGIVDWRVKSLSEAALIITNL